MINNKAVEKYVDVNSGDTSIITVEHRSGNKKREFLFVNKNQGKHIPTEPMNVVGMVSKLAFKVNEGIPENSDVLVVGFAETATALGEMLFNACTNAVYYLETTREDCAPCKKMLEFREEHSHATEQYIYGDMSRLPHYDYILFVDDEISTGKTILNFITEFEKLGNSCKYGVASICNWQNADAIARYNELGIDRFMLISGELEDAGRKMDVEVLPDEREYAAKRCLLSRQERESVNMVHLDSWNNSNRFMLTRTGHGKLVVQDTNLISDMWHDILNIADKHSKESMVDRYNNKALFIGTEECMYIPIMLAYYATSMFGEVLTHSTTRSSIDIIKGCENGDIREGIVSKYKLHSAYDSDRNTYIYNLDKYDFIFVICDKTMTKEFVDDMTSALVHMGNDAHDIFFIEVQPKGE